MSRKTKSILRLVVGLLLVAGIGAAIFVFATMGGGGNGDNRNIPTLPVSVGTFEKTVNSIGELRASKSTTVSAPYEGQVVKLVEEGTAVKQGDPIVWLSTTSIEDNLKEEEPVLALAQKDLETAKEQYRLQELQNEYSMKSEEAKVELAEQKLKDAEQKFETEKILVERKISARSELDAAQLSLLQAGVSLRSARIDLQKQRENLASNMRVKQTGIDKAQLAVEKSQRRIDEFKQDIEDGTLRAPANGEVSFLKVWKNGTVAKIAEGDNVWDRLSLLEIPDRSQMIAVVPVNELDIALVEQGQPVSIYLDAVPDRVFTGVVNRKSIVPIDNSQMSRRGPSTTQSQGPREFEVNVLLNEHEPFFFQGMTASVKIQVAKQDNALQVPLESLSLKGEEVGVYRSGVISDFVPVKVRNVNESTAVVEGALKAGDVVYLRNPHLELAEAREQGFEALRRVRRVLDAATEEKARKNLEEQAAQQGSRGEGRRRGMNGDNAGAGGGNFQGGGSPQGGEHRPGATNDGGGGGGESRRRRSQQNTEGGQRPAAAPAGQEAGGAAKPAASPAAPAPSAPQGN
ncbi:HlyD family efflux transporter periplasmic adaptor subunit [Candidatus Sumerlaeota bacterium]|nr:HlyD family efflux transporter periplasmic adaptor subunit [Candidatus Sumerlaeota bacterium]